MRALLTTIVAACLLVTGCEEKPREATRLNLLLISIDTLRADRLSGYGYGKPTSPRIDALMNASVVFEDAHATSSWTLASFASLMTGLYPSSHQCLSYSSKLDDSYTTLAEILRDQGYATASVVSHVFLGQKYGMQQGFEHAPEELVLPNMARSNEQITSPRVTDRALDWLRAQAELPDEQPWYLFVHYFDPHVPYNAHEGFTERFGTNQLAHYDGEIAFTDHHIGRLLDGLEEFGPVDDTVVVLVADHGEEFSDHGGRLHGTNLFREVMQVPFMIRAPSAKPRRVSDTVSLVDFLPTALELLRVPESAIPVAGRSLVPLLRGEDMEEAGALAELSLKTPFPADAYVLGKWKLVVGGRQPRDGGRPGASASDKIRLFDREADPTEQRDLSARHPDLVETLKQRIRAEKDSAHELCRRFREPQKLTHTEQELNHLRALGYVD